MSVVTDVLITAGCSVNDGNMAPRLTQVLRDIGYLDADDIAGELFGRLDVHARGNKAMQASVYGAALNYFAVHLPAFLDGVVNLPWTSPESVRVFVQHENDDWFHEVARSPRELNNSSE